MHEIMAGRLGLGLESWNLEFGYVGRTDYETAQLHKLVLPCMNYL